MKKLILLALLVLVSGTAFAYGEWGTDNWGHATKYKNFWQDRDGDGVPNYYDRRDDNRYIY